jgi:pectate lyase
MRKTTSFVGGLALAALLSACGASPQTGGSAGTGAAAGTSGAAGTTGAAGTSGAAGAAAAGTSGAPDAAADAGVDRAEASTGHDAATATDADAPAPRGDVGGACPTALVGWAAVEGDGVATTTGGGTAAPVRPKTADELAELAADDQPRVIELAGTFTIPRLQVASNKTLVGVGAGAKIVGGVRVRGSAEAPVRNVILRNLSVDGATSQVDSDAVQLYFAHHVWIDHVEIWDGPDGNLDMTHAVNWVTVSWSKFRYSAAYQRPAGESADHRFSSLVGHSDGNAKEDAERLKITFHHDWWAEGVIERMPRVRFGQVHVFNNLFAAPGNNYCVRAGAAARLLVEGNAFEGVRNPHEFNSADDEETASITARDNSYTGTTGLQATGGGGVALASVPYAATIEPAAGVGAAVRACAGPH